MPSQDETNAAEVGSSGSRRLSRRSLLAGAATAGAAGLAATAMSAAPALAGTGHPAPVDHEQAKLPAGPIVLNMSDPKTGDIEVLYGTSQVQLQDKELAARIVKAIG
jgi:hypothetical protein